MPPLIVRSDSHFTAVCGIFQLLRLSLNEAPYLGVLPHRHQPLTLQATSSQNTRIICTTNTRQTICVLLTLLLLLAVRMRTRTCTPPAHHCMVVCRLPVQPLSSFQQLRPPVFCCRPLGWLWLALPVLELACVCVCQPVCECVQAAVDNGAVLGGVADADVAAAKELCGAVVEWRRGRQWRAEMMGGQIRTWSQCSVGRVCLRPSVLLPPHTHSTQLHTHEHAHYRITSSGARAFVSPQ